MKRLKRIGMPTLWLALAASGMAQQLLTGTIRNPSGEQSAVTAWASYFDEGAMVSIASGTVEADGSFSLELPASLDGNYLREADINTLCSEGGSGVSMTPASFPHAIVNYLLAHETTTPVGAVLASSPDVVTRLFAEPPAPQPGDFLVYLLYVPTDVSVTGECIASDGTPVSYDIDASAGWSYVEIRFNGAEGDAVVTTVDDLPEGAAWQSSPE